MNITIYRNSNKIIDKDIDMMKVTLDTALAATGIVIVNFSPFFILSALKIADVGFEKFLVDLSQIIGKDVTGLNIIEFIKLIATLSLF